MECVLAIASPFYFTMKTLKTRKSKPKENGSHLEQDMVCKILILQFDVVNIDNCSIVLF